MCGIVGYVGDRRAQPILLNCLRKLEYRGYDSCGIAVASAEIQTCKDVIRVEDLAKQSPLFAGSIGIGHTRWATHGPPSRVKPHPHLDCSCRIAVVHNGVVANHEQLKRQLIGEGHKFLSENDTEVIPHLVEKHFRGDLVDVVVFCPRCKTMDTLSLNNEGTVPTRRFTQRADVVYHACGSDIPCRLYSLK